MNLLKKSLLSPIAALLICTTVYADDISYSIEKQSLKEAIELISKKSSTPYIANSSLLDGKTSSAIKDIKGTKNALDKILENSGLEAIIEDGAIIIKKKAMVAKGTLLEEISVNDSYSNGSVEDGYLVENITGVGLWGERSLHDTPYSMSVISNDLIENSLAKDMNQIFKMNPTTQETGQFVTGLGDAQWVTIRGFATNNPIINGIPYSNEYVTVPMMQDIERVEIINGATGFLYGGGRVGGAVNYITKKSTVEDLRTLSIGSYGNESYFSHIDLGGQFDDNHTFGYRINAIYQNGELPSNIDKEEKAVSLVFDWKPTDNFYTDIKYSYKEYLEEGGNFYFNNVSNRKAIDKSESFSPDWIQEELKSNKIENNIKWNINDIFTLRTNLVYAEMKSSGSQMNVSIKDNMIIANSSSFWKGSWQDIKNYGANIYLDSNFDTLSLNHNLTMGYSTNISKRFRSADHAISQNLSNDIYIKDIKNLSEPDWSSLKKIGTTSRIPFSKIQYNNILIGDDIVLNEQWSALVGVNYASVIDTNYRSNTKYDKSELTPTFSIIYKPFEKLTTYTTYIESLEAGNIVGSTYQNEGDILDPYKSKQYEIGAKYSLLDERILLTSALFRIEKANSYEDTTTTLKPILTQDGEQIHQGIELGIMGKVTDNLTVIAGGTLMDLSVEKVNNPILEGKKPTNAATKMAKLYAEYKISQFSGFAITGGAYYTGEKYGDSSNTDKLPSYTLYDLGARYKTKLDKYPTTFNLNIQNLTDEVYWTRNNMLGDSRTVALSMKMEF
jgi:iron complex outermembrane receptor protein